MLQKMFGVTQCGVVVLLMTSLVGAAPYSKYGRTCKDIGCPSSEVCVMSEDPCTGGYAQQCGRYPTCKRATEAGAETCTTHRCPSGQYCKTEDGRPTCVNTGSGNGYESAGVSSVNGQPSQTNVHRDTPSISSNSNDNPTHNINPYANANAPSIPISPGQNYPVNSGTNLGYPAYPSNTGSNSGSSGSYPSYPSNTGSSSGGTNLGYPPYHTVNRMPVPGQTNYPQSNYPQSNYPAQSHPGYPQQNPPVGGYPGGYPQQNPPVGGYPGGYPQQNNYPQVNYPGHQNYPTTYQNRGYNYNSNTKYRKSGSSITTPAISLLIISFFIVAKYFS